MPPMGNGKGDLLLGAWLVLWCSRPADGRAHLRMHPPMQTHSPDTNGHRMRTGLGPPTPPATSCVRACVRALCAFALTLLQVQWGLTAYTRPPSPMRGLPHLQANTASAAVTLSFPFNLKCQASLLRPARHWPSRCATTMRVPARTHARMRHLCCLSVRQKSMHACMQARVHAWSARTRTKSPSPTQQVVVGLCDGCGGIG